MTSSSSKKTPATPAEYITSLELLVQAYRTDYELCILCVSRDVLPPVLRVP